MNQFKIHILFKFVEGPWGGGNQFLKALRNYFRIRKVYEENPYEADVILFNSNKDSLYNLINKLSKVKRRNNPIIINRIDGPINLINPHLFHIDKASIDIDNYLCDGSIFQSNWIYEEMLKIGFKRRQNYTILYNSPDPTIFYRKRKFSENEKDKKIKIVATSWSSNVMKGFDIYKYLDNHLDFDKFIMTFIGNTPVTFKNIDYIPPLNSNKLADKLRVHDIFITSSNNDPCSNSLIEALHCGLPAVVLKSGGHPEIVKEAGEVFESKNDVIQAINKVANNLDYYRNKIDVSTIDKTGQLYYDFILQTKSFIKKKGNVKTHVKLLNFFKLQLKVKTHLIFYRLINYYS